MSLGSIKIYIITLNCLCLCLCISLYRYLCFSLCLCFPRSFSISVYVYVSLYLFISAFLYLYLSTSVSVYLKFTMATTTLKYCIRWPNVKVQDKLFLERKYHLQYFFVETLNGEASLVNIVSFSGVSWRWMSWRPTSTSLLSYKVLTFMKC
jgi:hypothetical protein